MTEQELNPSEMSNVANPSQKREQFLANTRHELRTPLNAILGYSEMLLEEAEEASQATNVLELSLINTRARQLLRLIGPALDPVNTSFDLAQIRADFFTPLNQIHDCVTTLLRQARGQDCGTYLEDLGQIELAVQRLSCLVDELLTAACFKANL